MTHRLENDEGDIWAVEELRYREWRVSSLHWTNESARSMLDRLASMPGHDPARWRVEPWLVIEVSEADDPTFDQAMEIAKRGSQKYRNALRELSE